jgi:hypothetical protein
MLSITEVFVNSPDFLVLLDIAAMDVGYTYLREDSMVRASRCDRFCFRMAVRCRRRPGHPLVRPCRVLLGSRMGHPSLDRNNIYLSLPGPYMSSSTMSRAKGTQG